MATPEWALRPATAEVAEVLTDIVVTATKAQGRWSPRSAKKEREWRRRFVAWSRETATTADPSNALSVIEVADQAVGRLRVVRTTEPGPDIELAGIQLRPRMQGRGIGTAVVRELQREAALRGGRLTIGVEKDNPRARALYERLGCVLVGESDDEYTLLWTGTT